MAPDQTGWWTPALRARVLTAGLLAPLVMVGVLLLPTGWVALLMALFVAMGAWEWSGLAGFEARQARLGYVVLTLLCLLFLWLAAVNALGVVMVALAALWWLLLSVRLGLIERIDQPRQVEPMLLLLGALVLVAPWLALVLLHGLPGDGPGITLGLLMLIWIADSAAYFGGRHFGGAKLSVLLSPGKTRAGVYTGLAAAALWGALIAALLGLSAFKTLLIVLICVVTAVMSVVGDLFESLLKRRRGIKDAGSLLPGHGGMLDRIDSLTAAAPIFALGYIWLIGGQ
ncbi:MAG: phosphatidate cytidylyltransferase [Lamprobacter sp.]|uniref:phosphatidate cytidylyltransferase n=1 Tax=Lamprobacter sp. TaxID=3100796 RepID=UPI002B25CB0D|nr:phosphatidate cytidylyltransferase [Lamprobacter sp.]MEA3639416.1 phosphatidate cytidylyltransferase [Lamprobacter sp.]